MATVRPNLCASMLTALKGDPSSAGRSSVDGEIRTEAAVDIERFMGEWYVIANIPTPLEKNLYDARETYELDYDGSIATTFSFRKGGFDAVQKSLRARGFIRDRQSNAIWGMRFLWPFVGDYRILYLNEDYTQTIVGRNRRDYAWIMARTPSVPNEELFQRVRFLREQGYDTDQVQLVPQRQE